MTSTPDPAAAALIDFDRTTCLCDAGQADYLAATAVSEDGSTSRRQRPEQRRSACRILA